MKKLNKVLLVVIPTLILAIIAFVIVPISLGWYTNVKKVGHIDANTKNASFNYKINNQTLETDEYHISNLVFFDIDSIYEGKHFDTMVYRIALDVQNITDNEMEYSVIFEGDRLYTQDKTISYVGCVVSPDEIEKHGYSLTEDEEAKEGKTYYSYNSTTEEYEAVSISAGTTINPDDDYYEYSYYIQDSYEATTDDVVKLYKTYYKSLGSGKYRMCATLGNPVANEDQTIYEIEYQKATSYDSSKTYYQLVTSNTGTFYVEVDAAEAALHPTEYYLPTSTYIETEDTLFQNKDYYIEENNQKVQLDVILAGSTTTSKSYYEKGNKVEDLLVTDQLLGVTYTENEGTQNPFIAKYDGGKLGAKNSTTLSDTQRIYLYVFGVQEIDSAQNEDFIEKIHTFRITIEAKTESNWTASNVTTTTQA